jgi:hypothetical protein
MPDTAGDTGAVAALRARATLVRTVRALLQGSGLDLRELAHELVISQPGRPDLGRIYIKYANGEVTLRRCRWEYLGCLDGYGSDDPEAEPGLNAAQLIGALLREKAP